MLDADLFQPVRDLDAVIERRRIAEDLHRAVVDVVELQRVRLHQIAHHPLRVMHEADVAQVVALEVLRRGVAEKRDAPTEQRRNRPARSRIAESSRPNERTSARKTPGEFHGSARLGVIIDPFAKLVSRPAPAARSTT